MSSSIKGKLFQPSRHPLRASPDATGLVLPFKLRDRLGDGSVAAFDASGPMPTPHRPIVAEPSPVPFVPFPWFDPTPRST